MILHKPKPNLIIILTVVLSLAWLSAASYVVASVPTTPISLYLTKSNASLSHTQHASGATKASTQSDQTTQIQITEPAAPTHQSTAAKQSVDACPDCLVEFTPGTPPIPCSTDCTPSSGPTDCPVCKPTKYHTMCPMIACRAE